VGRDRVAFAQVRVDPDPLAFGKAQAAAPCPGVGLKFCAGSSALMRHWIAWPRKLRLDVERLVRRDAQLELHEIEAREHLGHRVLDLKPRVHLHEPEIARVVEEHLDGTGAAVAEPRARIRRARTDLVGGVAIDRGLGASSRSFWWRRCTEHSRSRSGIVSSPSPSTWISMCRRPR
jgi:hypothetical protein